MEVARQTAIDRAKLQILANTFGTVIQSASSVRIDQSAGASSVGTSSLSISEVRGEWIETTEGPDLETILSPDGMIGLRVRMSGRVREITSARAETEVQVLRNGTDPRFSSLEFRDGDDLFLRFKSPVDGNLLVYLFDGGENVYCLLPYSSQRNIPAYPIRAMHEYLLFAGDDADEYTLTCTGKQEINRLYVIFSPQRLTRPFDTEGRAATTPRMLSWKAFNQFLARARTADPEMVVGEYMIIID